MGFSCHGPNLRDESADFRSDWISFVVSSDKVYTAAASAIDEIKRTQRKWEVNVVDEYVVNTFYEKRRQRETSA